jgi:uncharacterized protein (DUF2252 family)
MNPHQEAAGKQHAHAGAAPAKNGAISQGTAVGNGSPGLEPGRKRPGPLPRTSSSREFVTHKVISGKMVGLDVDLRREGPTRDKLREDGRQRRARVPRESHAEWIAPKNRPDPVATVLASNKGRQPELIPLRMGRMAASPFTFLRGAAAVMAWDLSKTSNMGHTLVIDGDAHLNNFGFFGTPQRDLVMDLNDFDEATFGPWEWDLKRLASVNVAARENGMNSRDRRASVMRCVEGYRANAQRLQAMPSLDIWYLHANVDRVSPLVKIDPESQAILAKAAAKARLQTNAALLQKIAERRANAAWQFRTDPAILTPIDSATREKVIEGLNGYTSTLLRERKSLLRKYHVVDVAHRVVGVGSVGTRAYLVLLMGRGDDDALFLQVKEATVPAQAPYLPKLPEEFSHDGKRVVSFQRALQASSDLLLGWTSIDNRPFYVRQMKNMKGGMPVEFLVGEQMSFYAWACGAILARAHARVGEPALIAGYCGGSKVLDEALADWAESYGDQNELDHAALVKSIKTGRVKAKSELQYP